MVSGESTRAGDRDNGDGPAACKAPSRRCPPAWRGSERRASCGGRSPAGPGRRSAAGGRAAGRGGGARRVPGGSPLTEVIEGYSARRRRAAQEGAKNTPHSHIVTGPVLPPPPSARGRLPAPCRCLLPAPRHARRPGGGGRSRPAFACSPRPAASSGRPGRCDRFIAAWRAAWHNEAAERVISARASAENRAMPGDRRKTAGESSRAPRSGRTGRGHGFLHEL
jgi:hypothetical protein